MPTRKKPECLYGSTGNTGTVAELLVATDLMKQGFEVFKALSPHCSCDLIAFDGDKCYRIEVKTGYVHPTNGIRYGGKKLDPCRYDVMAVVVLWGDESIRYCARNGAVFPPTKAP